MKTVRKMIEELRKFPPDAKCYAYEGEASGLGITYGQRSGFIFCDPSKDDENLASEAGEKKV